jgi:hypothetical protein
MTVTEQQATVGVRASGCCGYFAMKSGGSSGFDMPLSGATTVQYWFYQWRFSSDICGRLTVIHQLGYPTGGCYKRVL